ncbi:MAG: dockerin type I domain-containing protein [Phycisphaerales bacterium]|nr:dockerin type I domain-containing protein [Phycisphaerales bacterium]
MKYASCLSTSAAFCLAATASADITGVYTTRYTDISEDRGQALQTTTVIDLYVSSDDDADTVLGIFDFSLTPEAQVIYFQSASEPAFPTNTWWLPKNLGGFFDIESVRRSDSFVTIGGVEQNVLRPEQSPGVGAGQSLDEDFAAPFDLFFAYPQPNSGGWWNSTPETLAGQVGPVALAGPDGEPSGFGRGVFVGRFSYYGDFSIEGTTLTVAWNQGPGTPQQEADFTIPPVVADPTECPGDITEDGVVDGADVAILLAVWGTDGDGIPGTDINGDGTVDGTDLAFLLAAWDVCP